MALTDWSREALTWTCLAFIVGKLLMWRQKIRKLPPGPPKLPLIDNMHNMPNGLDWVKFAEFGVEYNSDIIHLSALGTSIVVLNSYQAAQDLLEQRSGIYSSRPSTVMASELAGGNKFFVFAPYGDVFRICRRLFTRHFGPETTKLNQPQATFYVRRYLGHLLDKPQEFRHYASQLFGAISVSMTYGIRPRPDGDPYIESAEKAVATLSGIVAGTYLVDFFPFLKYIPAWFPGAAFRRVGISCQNQVNATQSLLFRMAKQMMENDSSTASFVSEALEDLEGAQNEDLIINCASTVYFAAAETSLSVLTSFILAMTCFPEVQEKAQEELDAVLEGRLPEHEDIASLPYLTAVVLESLRWNPVLPLGIPHAVILDDIYNGYHIPKGSIVLGNAWAMFHNPVDYPDPFQFKPERFLNNGGIDESVRSPVEIVFGFGRRICPGRHIALVNMRMAIASILSTFDVSKKVDANGNPIEPSLEYTPSISSHPKKVVCDIKPRSRHAAETIRAWAATENANAP